MSACNTTATAAAGTAGARDVDPQAGLLSTGQSQKNEQTEIVKSGAGRASVAWAIVGILAMVAIESAISAFTYPYFSLALEKHGLSNWMIGLNASVAGAGILFVGPFLPRVIAQLGLQRLSAAMFGLPLLCFAAMLVVDHIAMWFVARFIMGACFAALWAVTEIWLNGVVSDRQRGRVLSLAMILYTAAQFVGPLTVSLTGVVGLLPFVI
ncbi:MAG: MFS transporter, partial [bacterium]|nr:MFS transporter [bacterium]